MFTDIYVSATMLDIVLKATVLLTAAWISSFLLRRRSAAIRHLVQVFVAAALLLLPLPVVLLPAWYVPGIPTFGQSQTSGTLLPTTPVRAEATPLSSLENTKQLTHDVETRRPGVSPLPRDLRWNHANSSAAPRPHASAIANEVAKAANNNAPSASIGAQGSTRIGQTLAALLFTAWISGTIYFLARWRMHASRLSAVVRRAAVVTDSGWNTQLRALAEDLEINRHVALLVSNEIEIPITTGMLYPSLVLSPDYAEWSAARRLAILNHELAHITRWDALTQVLAQMAAGLYWFHPLVWQLVRAMRADQERACDDLVLAAGTKASDYAHELLAIVSELHGPELAAALAMARRSQLEGRLLALLNPSLPRGTVSRKSALAAGALTLMLILPLAALRPAAQDNDPSGNGKNKPSPAQIARPGSAVAPAVAGQPEAPSVAPTQPSGPLTGPSEAPSPLTAPAAPTMSLTAAAPGSPLIAPAASHLAPAGDLSVCGTNTKLHNMQIQSSDGSKRWTANWSGDDCSVELRAEGEVKFNAEATEIQSISPGGFFEVNVRQGDTLKQVKVTPSGGALQYVYKINGQQQPFEGEAKTWFSQLLLDLERSTGFAADARVPALLAKGGPAAVLDEINNLHGDYVRGIYFRKLLEQPNLPTPVVQRVIRQAGEQISSDYELARVLMTVAKQYELADEASRTDFLNAAGKLKSDYEHARVLIELLRRPNISKESVNLALKSATTISSDYEKSRILLSLMDQKTFEQSQLDFYLKLADSIASDYEKSRDLLAPMQRFSLRPDQVNSIMAATSTIGSDYEKSRLLIGLAGKGKFDEGQMNNYLKAVDSMQSDYERSRSLLELMKDNALSATSVSKALQEVSREQSDYEKSRVILSLVQANKFDENQMTAYLAVVHSMQSDNERARCLISLMEHNKLSDASVAKVLSEAGRINSDYEKARLLLAVASRYALTGSARESYIKSADSISSEYERNRALAAVVKRATL